MLLLILLPVSASADPVAPVFDPIRFFEGRTRGTGALKIILRTKQPITVDGIGRIEADGSLVLSQQVTQGSAPPRTREWRIRETSTGHYTGTLTDAAGPVTGDSMGRVLTLRYPAKGVAIEQILTLADDGRSARNVLTARKMGIAIARLDETIVKEN